MRALLKITFTIVFALLATVGLKAQIIEPMGLLGAAGGSSLGLELSSANISFIQNEGQSAADQTTTVTIRSTHTWTFSVYTDADNMVATDDLSHKIPVSNVSLSGFINGTLENGKEVALNGSGNSGPKTITWKLTDPGNVYAGTYQAPISFKLVKTN